MTNKKLTAKQAKFCQEYMVDLNATQAAVRAGYSAKTANVTGFKLLVNPSIAPRIAEMQAEGAQRAELSADWVLQELKGNHKQARENDELGHSNKALELIGKHIGMFIDKQELNSNVTVEIIQHVIDGGGDHE